MQIVLQDGRVELEDSLVENAIRPIALGHKNYLFAGSHEAAKRAAMVYSFFSACKQAAVNPKIGFYHIADTKIGELHYLFLQNWKPGETRGA